MLGYLLGLSDLHFASELSQETLLALLVEDLQSEFNCSVIHGVVLCGDITEHATPRQYDLASRFLDGLAQRMRIPPNSIAACPGNHDVDWTASQEGAREVVAGAAIGDLEEPHSYRTADGVHIFEPDAYRNRFLNYSKFHSQTIGSKYGLAYREQYTLTHFRSLGLSLLGLNSAYPLDHIRRDDPDIYVGAVNKALAEFSFDCDVADSQRLAFWHHPLNSSERSRLKSDAFARRLTKLGFSVGIHGHIHDSEADRLRYQVRFAEREMEIISVGTFGAKESEVRLATPWQYTLFEVQQGEIIAHVRARTTFDSPWRPHAVFPASDGTGELQPRYVVPLPGGVGKHEWIRTRKGLETHLKKRRLGSAGYSIAVEAHIFDKSGRLLLQRRGPECRDEIGRLEGVGGDIEGRDDLLAALEHWIRDEIGDVAVRTDAVLEVRPVTFEERHGKRDWLIVSYLCRLESGVPSVQDAGKTLELVWFRLDEIMKHPDADLSRSTSRALAFYKLHYGLTPYFLRKESP